MSTDDKEQNQLLPHHEQQNLCTTRLPYRQGRKLTAVKVYTINNESKHLLIFGVPSLNLRQETKALFMKFGKILQFNLTKYPSEQFTETFHVDYECIQSARIAKKMLDTKNFYGGILHVCYAPEMESIEETKQKLLLRKTQVLNRLRNLEKEAAKSKEVLEKKIEEKMNEITVENKNDEPIIQKEKMYMGSINKISFGKRKIKEPKTKGLKKLKSSDGKSDDQNEKISFNNLSTPSNSIEITLPEIAGPSNFDTSSTIDIVDCTSAHREVISNINEALNYKDFGNEVIKKIPYKPLNKIQFNINKKS